jgi:biopolymer transport protein ExbD
MRLPSHHGRTDTGVAMTPMIDVVFQLLIFFICTASFQGTEELLPLGLAMAAETGAASAVEVEPDSERLVVRAQRVAGETQWLLNNRRTGSLAEVRLALEDAAASDAGRAVTLDVAGDVPLGDMIDAYDLCRIVGLEKIEFAVQQR